MPKPVERVHLCSDMISRTAILRVHVVPNAKSDSVVGGGREGQRGAGALSRRANETTSACYRAATRSQLARQTDSRRWLEPRRHASPSTRESRRIERYSVMILSAHSTSDTKILGLPNLAPYSFKSVSSRLWRGSRRRMRKSVFSSPQFSQAPSDRGGQATGTTALATDFRISETASPRRKI
jgi:hypothetical protein